MTQTNTDKTVGGWNKSKLTAEKVSEMRLLRAQGRTVMQIAQQFGVTWTGAYNAISGATWKSVKTPVVLKSFHQEAAKGADALILARFEDKWMPEPMSGCWLWLGTVFKRDNGDYGHVRIGGVLQSAHRAAWELYKGPIPDGLLACHKCDNPTCVNPDHLFLGTASDNMQDMHAKGRHKNSKHRKAA